MRFYCTKTLERHEVTEKGVSRALKKGYVPSVTTILGTIRYDFLERWKTKNILEYYTETGDIDGALSHSDSTSSEFGTVVHALAEEYMGGDPCTLEVDERHLKAVQPVFEWVDANVDEVVFNEAQFADAQLGYAGTADMLLKLKNGRLVLADLKCKKHSKTRPMKPSMDYRYQLSAYRQYFQKEYGEMGIMNLLCASPFYHPVYGSEPEPLCLPFDYEDDDWMTGFNAAFHIWKEVNGVIVPQNKYSYNR